MISSNVKSIRFLSHYGDDGFPRYRDVPVDEAADEIVSMVRSIDAALSQAGATEEMCKLRKWLGEEYLDWGTV